MNESTIKKQTDPKVFGQLYVAVFSNGTVKAGMSHKDANSRVTSHAHAGKAFGISMDSSFVASIYTSDVKAREKLMHQELALLATPTAGREWFKFEDAQAALNFASTYLHKVERMSFAERPSPEELERARARAANTAKTGLALTDRLFNFGNRETKEQKIQKDITNAEQFLDTLDARLIFVLASKMIDSDESNFNPDAPSRAPILSDIVEQHWCAFYANHRGDSPPLSACSAETLAVAEPGDPIDMTLNLKVARAILSAAMLYPAFFYQACTDKPYQVAEVAA
ncbi:MAG: hypothetical protein ACMV1D_09930 [Macromonas sp.]